MCLGEKQWDALNKPSKKKGSNEHKTKINQNSKSITKEKMLKKVEFFIKTKKYDEKSPRTLKQYNRVIMEFIATIPDGVEIAKDHTLEYKQKLKDAGMMTSTINNKIVILDSFLKFIKLDCLCVNTIKVQKKSSLKNVLEPIDYKRLLHWAKKLEMVDIRMIMRVLAETGARIAELTFFTADAIKESNYINVSNKGKERNLIIRNDLRKELKEFCCNKKITEGYIFRGRLDESKPLCEATIWRNMQKIAGRAKVNKKKVHAHSFRHLFAIRWIEEGGSIADLADIMGHNSLETTRIYTKTTDLMKKRKIENMKY